MLPTECALTSSVKMVLTWNEEHRMRIWWKQRSTGICINYIELVQVGIDGIESELLLLSVDVCPTHYHLLGPPPDPC